MDLSKVPAATPPPGLQTNFVDPPSLLGAVIASTVVIQLVTLPFIFARIYVNAYTRTLKIEDYCAYLAWAAFVVQTALTCLNSSRGMARHIWDVSLATLMGGSHLYNILFMFYSISGGFAKATVFLQFKRIFTHPKIRGPVYWVITISLIANALAYTCFLFLYIFTCWPREKIWNPTVPGNCMSWSVSLIAIGALNTFSDIEAFFVPMWALWQLRMEVRKKIGVFAVFAVGALAVAIGCLGMYYRVLILQRPDKTWLLTQTSIICMAELAIVLIVSCCPYLPRIYRRHKHNPHNQNSYKHPSSSNSRSNRFHSSTRTTDTIGSKRSLWRAREKLGISTIGSFSGERREEEEDWVRGDEFLTIAAIATEEEGEGEGDDPSRGVRESNCVCISETS
ncbi:hypothetical protein BDV96DRAFT_504878 [Lophiotrema nucula]|uniref:Rhodopsin domain-containing protein n=1 Tax=Lophiotrema nucula TaxID=690887 RepID=A0A6A5YLJ2_9PLEO|nr:hypothetical protein BDV96DRAFT_504878 [Lophiotrema nucula]